jgi:sugar transferase EpsL
VEITLRKPIYKLFKRTFDFLLALLLLIILFPVILVVAIVVRIKLGTPVLFSQVRPGKNARPFTVYKFRTMTEEKNKNGELLPDAQRLEGVGKTLRKLSLDELPQLFNVLKGEMSFVGPRPLLMQYLPLYSPFQARRMEVTPGITGWAQVNGRNATTWEKRFEHDIWYVDNCSFFLDLKILIMTFVATVKQEGINQQGSATMEYFTGNDPEED